MRKSCGTYIYGRMIPLHQSFAWEPLRLYGSLCAVKVVLAALRSTAGALDCARSANYVEVHIIGEMLRTQKCGVGGAVGCAFDHWRQLRGAGENATLPDHRALEFNGRPFPQRQNSSQQRRAKHSLRTRAAAMGCVEPRSKTC
jgi:hypothetical protein